MENNWYVITGAPSSGKTTIIDLLKDKSCNVVHEMARIYLNEEMQKGKTLEEIRKNEVNFQEKVLDLKIDYEKDLPKNEVIFFDRAIPDSYAYLKLYGVSDDSLLKKSLNNSHYKKVFLLDFLEYKKDYARIETQEQQKQIHDLLRESYNKTNADIIEVPIMSPKERVEFILSHL